MSEPSVVIEEIGGNCPVQAEGTINGKRFYFRARGEHWRVEVHPTAKGDFLDWPDDGMEWRTQGKWGDGPYAAGWMPEDVARDMIAKAAAEHAKTLEQRPEVGDNSR